MSGGLIRGKDIRPDDVLDRIYKAWVTHKIKELALQDHWILVRMEYIDALLREGGERSRYKNVVEDTYQNFLKDHDVSRRTIETDIARTKVFFLSARPREEKEYARGKSIEWGERMMWKAEECGDFMSASKFFKELNEIQGFKKDDIDRPDYAALQPPPLMVVMDAAELGVPVIDNLEEELRILNMPKAAGRKTEQFDDAEDTGEGE